MLKSRPEILYKFLIAAVASQHSNLFRLHLALQDITVNKCVPPSRKLNALIIGVATAHSYSNKWSLQRKVDLLLLLCCLIFKCRARKGLLHHCLLMLMDSWVWVQTLDSARHTIVSFESLQLSYVKDCLPSAGWMHLQWLPRINCPDWMLRPSGTSWRTSTTINLQQQIWKS